MSSSRVPIVTNLPKFRLAIDGLNPASPIQGRPVQLAFTLTNLSGVSTSGTVTSDFGGEFPITLLSSGASQSGSLTFIAPSTGKGITILLQYFSVDAPVAGEFRQATAEASIEVDINSGFILEIADTFANPSHDTLTLEGAKSICQNDTFPTTPLEWTPVLGGDEFGGDVGVSGWAINPQLSGPGVRDDFPFSHPFGNDWKFWIAPDRAYESLLAPGNRSDNTGKPDNDSLNAINIANAPNGLNLNTPGVIELEIDRGLVPEPFRAREGDRVAVLGRWIVDCGHDNYTSEIHPPLLLATARRTENADGTSVTLIGRAFLVSQIYEGGTFMEHLVKELAKATAEGVAAGPFSPLVPQLSVRPRVVSPPFSGIRTMSFVARPPSGRSTPADRLLLSFHFTVRTGVAVEVVAGPDPDEVTCIVVMNDALYKPAAQPPMQDVTVNVLDLGPDVLGKAAAVNIFDPFVNFIVGKGILTSSFELPPPQSPLDNKNVVTNVDVNGMAGNSSVSLDDNQPYPIYGWLTLTWDRRDRVSPLVNFAGT